MTKDENRTATLRMLISGFVFRHSFDIRHSSFVIYTASLARYASLGMTFLSFVPHFFIISSRFALNSVPGFHSGNLSPFATS
jgi:hypothetical protein